MDLLKLAEPFPAEDIEWRVSRAGVGKNGVWCKVLAYVTARAIAARLDEVCGPENWQITQPSQLSHERKCSIAVGIAIRCGDEWVTKWDVCELTDSNENIPPFKGGFSGAIKRAGAQWGIFRYGYYLDETYADVSDTDPGVRGWHYAKLPKSQGGAAYYWKTPTLPGWALPAEPETAISKDDLNALKTAWRGKFAPEVTSRAELAEGFQRFVSSVCGSFPSADHSCWTKDELAKCVATIEATTDPGGVSPDVPFAE